MHAHTHTQLRDDDRVTRSPDERGQDDDSFVRSQITTDERLCSTILVDWDELRGWLPGV